MPQDFDDAWVERAAAETDRGWRLWVTSPRHLVITTTVVATLGLMVGYLIMVLFVFTPQNVAAGLIRVPDVVGQTAAEALARAQRSRLEYEEATAIQHTLAAGTVIAQEPLAGQMTPPGSAVRVTLSAGPPQRPVPDVVGLSHDQAEVVLARSGFGVEVTWVDASEDVGQVVGARPEPGTRLEIPGSVRILVSAGERAVQVPDLRMRSLDEARLILERLGLQLGEIREDSATLAAPGTVLFQSPAFGTEAARATRVAVTIAVAPPAPVIDTTTVPADTGAAAPDTAGAQPDTARQGLGVER